MSDLIKVPYTELFYRASRIRQEASAIRAEIQLLQETVESIEWVGKRADKFFAMWRASRPEMESWALLLEGFADRLDDHAQRVQATDEAF